VQAAARICSELARVLDPADLPQILAESASLLDARGLIVWVADRSGSSLFPMLAHGYAPAVLSRMGSIQRDDDNATALAFRLSEDRVVSARNGYAGAIVTPIVTPEGCVGVLAAEVNGGIENSPDRRALAGILAAQLATLVTNLPAPSERIQAQG
jgi:GAF domain-containing protein